MCAEPVALRPHHGMCLAYFVGKGYSGPFAENMAALLAALTEERERAVTLACRCDAVCAACPRQEAGRCREADKTERYDRAVLAACGLAEEQVLPFSRFAAAVEERILAPGRREGICGDCCWNAVCAVQPSRWRQEK